MAKIKLIVLTFVLMSLPQMQFAQGFRVYGKDGSVKEFMAKDVDRVEFFEKNIVDHEYVDLGLPSGTLWAKVNLGAESPTEYGDYLTRDEAINKISENWGDDWHIPTYENFQELYSNCTLTWTTLEGVWGTKATRNGKSIFFPASGLKFDNKFINDPGTCGCYNIKFMYYLNMNSSAWGYIQDFYGYFSLTTRPVK